MQTVYGVSLIWIEVTLCEKIENEIGIKHILASFENQTNDRRIDSYAVQLQYHLESLR